MSNLSERLATLTARDIMTEKLVLLDENDTIQRAANLFRDLQISGAPVVNSQGHAVGLLSVSDIVPAVFARVPPGGKRPQSREAEWDEICAILNAGSARAESGGSELVSRWMSQRLVSVREDAPLIEVARVMCDGHWHRVTVVDASGRLTGIVSTMDVLAALVHAADEREAG